MSTVKEELTALLNMLSGDLNYDNIHKVKDKLKCLIENKIAAFMWLDPIPTPDRSIICAPGSPQDLSNKRYDKIESAIEVQNKRYDELESAEVQDLRFTRGCLMAGSGRGDCEHFVGLPGKSIPGQHDGPDDTVDAYGRPNGWCEVCWRGKQIKRLQTTRVGEVVPKYTHHQALMELHDKGDLSTRDLCNEFGLDYEEEVKRLRETGD